MEIHVARPAGTCYGVERALKLAREAARNAKGAPVASLGELIHNPQAVDTLRLIGVDVVTDLSDLSPSCEGIESTLIIRSHGVAPSVIEDAEARGVQVVDATCPHVARVQEAAEQLAHEGFTVLIVGEPDHPEVFGIHARAGKKSHVVTGASDLPPFESLSGERVGVVIQTTQTAEALNEVVEELRDKVAELRVVNTICSATTRRQQATEALAHQVDVMVVVGGHNSGNTRRLYEISKEVCPHSYHIETSAELEDAWFDGAEKVGITAGASTPEDQLQSVVARIGEIDEVKVDDCE
ncbi:MAG: 4-hydroxy-3-methylbut-2-enyl diphosphate reductase [Coriobacteriia bacterium]|nr:4-hydroxy-3-methylbut-2-enyl diphosphate reductase [Coriobacteriia bacterium]MCL2745876.1 4-hydroxy-3-methylbut-2-enyl diphosphate reductase [Coriobacteriia bacterium]MCL2870328.1 4-hydroxy-3-methylbut-2-enyl diphosphate reductase [Coriobacteriia bacterium]